MSDGGEARVWSGYRTMGARSPTPATPLAEGVADTALARFLLDLRTRGLTEPALLNAFERVPRALFLPQIRPGLLYEPIALPIPCGEEAEDPFTLARLLVLARLAPGQRVLEIGTGSGFATALMAAAGAEIVTMERYASLALAATQRFGQLGLNRISGLQADGLAKRSLAGPFDRLIIHGAMDLVPQHLFEGLVPGGIAIGGRVRGGETRLTLWRIDGAGFPVESDIGPARMARMRSGLPVSL